MIIIVYNMRCSSISFSILAVHGAVKPLYYGTCYVKQTSFVSMWDQSIISMLLSQ